MHITGALCNIQGILCEISAPLIDYFWKKIYKKHPFIRYSALFYRHRKTSSDSIKKGLMATSRPLEVAIRPLKALSSPCESGSKKPCRPPGTPSVAKTQILSVICLFLLTITILWAPIPHPMKGRKSPIPLIGNVCRRYTNTGSSVKCMDVHPEGHTHD